MCNFDDDDYYYYFGLLFLLIMYFYVNMVGGNYVYMVVVFCLVLWCLFCFVCWERCDIKVIVINLIFEYFVVIGIFV